MKAFVIGGGPSAAMFDWSKVGAGDLTIACHEAANAIPFAPTVQLSVDRPYWVAHQPRLGSAGVWVTVGGRDSKNVDRKILRVPCYTGKDHWRLDWSDDLGRGVMVGGCSGVAAMNYAVLRGATEVHLVGIDLEGEGGVHEKWRESFQYAVDQCEARKVPVVCHGRWAPVSA